MSLLATQADFEQGGLYDPPYSRYPFFRDRLERLRGRFAPKGQKLLIVGCGYGYLVDEAVAAGYDAYGVDASAYAIARGKTLLPAVAGRLIQADALAASQLDAAAKTAGLKGATPRWPLLVTEDCLTCMPDAEVQAALVNLRARCTANLLHLVTATTVQSDRLDPRLNWKTLDGWRAVLCPPDLVGDCESGLFWNANGQA